MLDREANANNERFPRKEQLVAAVVDGLRATHALHEQLGESGRFEFAQNQWGENALVMDIRAEDAMLAVFRENHISAQVYSEEHGEFVMGENPKYTVVLDGLDGSGEYKEKRGEGMYGTMVSVLQGTEPCYKDYVISGIMIHSPEPQLLIGIKDEGCFVVDIETGKRTPLTKKNSAKISPQSVIDFDTNWPFKEIYTSNKNEYPNFTCRYLSEAARVVLFVTGKVDVALEWTRKGNLEQACAYGLVTEAGGVMTTVEGEDIGEKQFKTFGQQHIPLVLASSHQAAQDISRRLNLELHSS